VTQRDDMVVRPTLGPQQQASAKTRAREERRIARAHGKGGVLRRLRMAQQMRRRRRRLHVARQRQKRKAMQMAGRAAIGRGATAVAGAAGARIAARVGAGALFSNPVTGVLAALAVGAAISHKLYTGKSFEQMGDQLNDMLLGDLDDEARAKMTVRHRFQGDELLSRIRGREGKVNSQLSRLHSDLLSIEKEREVGRSLIVSQFGVDGTWDMLLKRFEDKYIRAKFGDKFKDAVNEVARLHHARYNHAVNPSGR
tara:strand:+ start:444 stop:1205 length:762 start_codon:yes stop_codon:yes gene_type:complete